MNYHREHSTTAPSHATPAMAANILGIDRKRVYRMAKPGGKLEYETHFGEKLIPMWRVIRQLLSEKDLEEPFNSIQWNLLFNGISKG